MTDAEYGGCAIGPGIAICRPRGFLSRGIWNCPFEKVRRRVVIADEPWYGCKWYCCGCGHEWDSDEGHRRPGKAKDWQAKQRAKHRELWKTAMTRQEARNRIHEYMGW